MAIHLTMLTVMMFLASLTISGTNAKQSTMTENDIGALIGEELDKRLADVMTETAQETKELRSRLDRQGVAMQRLEEENAALRREIADVKQETDLMTQQMQHMLADPRHDEESYKVAFSVASHNNIFGPVEQPTTIPFDIIYVNTGSCWNPDANVFQALVAGVYYVTVSVRSRTTSQSEVLCDIVHTSASTGDTTVATLYGQGSSTNSIVSADANSVILDLGFGDAVSVRLRPSGEIYSDSTNVFSTFSGFLIFE